MIEIVKHGKRKYFIICEKYCGVVKEKEKNDG